MSGVVKLITVKIITNPFNVNEGEIKQVPFIKGEPVLYYSKSFFLSEDEIEIIHNCSIVEVEDFYKLIPNDGDFIAVMPRVAGGGGRGKKSILTAVAQIGLMMLTFGVGNVAAGFGFFSAMNTVGWGFWSYVAAAGTIMLGGSLINSMSQRPENKQSSTYSWNGIQPLIGQNLPDPVIFGRCRVAGRVVAKHVASNGESSFLNVLIEIGEGPCDYVGIKGENSDCTGITNIKIGDNPIANYESVEIHKRAGLNGQSVIPNFNEIAHDQNVNIELNTDCVTWTVVQSDSVNEVDALEFTFAWPNGLYDVDLDGNYLDNSVSIEMQYKLQANTDWISSSVTVTKNKQKPVFATFRFDKLTRGLYDKRCRMKWYRYNDTNEGDCITTYWQQVTGFTYDNFMRPNKVLLGIRALATDQINGGMPAITFEVIRSKVLVYDEDLGQYELKSATNPAWVAYWMLHRVYYLKDVRDNAWKYNVRGIPASRLVYSEFKAWATFCDENELYVNIYFDCLAKLSEQLKEVEQLGRGRVLPRCSKYGCIFDGPAEKDANGDIVFNQIFNMSNIVLDSYNEQYVSADDRATAIEVTYWDSKNNYEQTQMLVCADGLDQDAALVNTTQITLKGCVTREQAYREGKYRLRLNKISASATWGADIDAIVSSLGNVVGVQHDVPAWGIGGRIISATVNTITLDKSVLEDIQGNIFYDVNKQYQVLIRLSDDTFVYKNVLSVSETGDVITLGSDFSAIPDDGDLWNFGEVHKTCKPFKVTDIKRTGDLKYTILGLEYLDDIYVEDTEIPQISYSDIIPIVEVSNLKVREETFRQKDGTMISRLTCAWIEPRDKIADKYYVYYSVDDGATWVYSSQPVTSSAYIESVKTGVIYKVCVRVVCGPLVSNGVISDGVTITGKDVPPKDVPAFNIMQSGSVMKVSVTASDDPDVRNYVLRVGPTWENSALVQSFVGVNTTFDVTQEGTQTFWLKAYDNSNNQSVNAKKAVVTVFGIPQKNVIASIETNKCLWVTKGMFICQYSGCWLLDSDQLVGDNEYFCDMFNVDTTLRDDAEIQLPAVDLGQNVIEENYFYVDYFGNFRLHTAHGDEFATLNDYSDFFDLFAETPEYVIPQYKIETFLTVDVDYQKKINNFVNFYFRTGFDGVGYSAYQSMINHQFFGRYVQVKLCPGSLDDITNVSVCGAAVAVDVPDMIEKVDMTTVLNSGATRYMLKKRYFAAPNIELFSYDAVGKGCTNEIVDGVAKKNAFGIWYFDVKLWDGVSQIAGKIYGNARGY